MMLRFEGHSELALLHNLALLYLGLAEGADDDLAPAESHEIAARLRRWQPDKDPALISHVMRDVALSFREETAGEALREVVDDLGRHLSEDRRVQILYDLAGVARADGTVMDTERDFIRHVAAAWHLEGRTPPAA